MSKYITPKVMQKWVDSYPDISGYRNIEWPSYSELLNCFGKLLHSKNIGGVLRINYPGIHEKNDEFWYEPDENL